MTTNQTFKPSEGKREEFRKYLEKNGIMDALTKVLVNLYEEVDKPEDALQYIIDKLSIQAGLDTQKQLLSKLEDANNQVKSLEDQLEQLKLEQAPAPAEGEVKEDDTAAAAPAADPAAPAEPAPEEEPAPPATE